MSLMVLVKPQPGKEAKAADTEGGGARAPVCPSPATAPSAHSCLRTPPCPPGSQLWILHILNNSPPLHYHPETTFHSTSCNLQFHLLCCFGLARAQEPERQDRALPVSFVETAPLC